MAALILVLGDQLTETLPAIANAVKSKDTILMAEVREEEGLGLKDGGRVRLMVVLIGLGHPQGVVDVRLVGPYQTRRILIEVVGGVPHGDPVGAVI